MTTNNTSQYYVDSDRISFINKYESELRTLSKRINNKNPDHVVTIARSGTRLLELLEKNNFISVDVPVISDSALPFIPQEEFENCSVVIFDDVTNTGKTLFEINNTIGIKYNTSNVDPVTLAYDKDMCEIPKGAVGALLELTSSKRYQLVKDITQSFCHLNKPYDIDHPILYSKYENIGEISSHNNCYEITTDNQKRNRFRRFTFFPEEDSPIKRLCSNLISITNIEPDIEKLRFYLDERTKETICVPITSFPMKSNQISTTNIFNDKLPNCYNNIISASKRELENASINSHSFNKNIHQYRIIWFLINYLYGVGYSIEYDDLVPDLIEPSLFMNRRDIEYLFGSSMTEVIMTALDENFNETVTSIENILSEKKGCPTPINQIDRETRDWRQEEVYDNLESYIGQNVDEEMTYSDRLSSVFEGIEFVLAKESSEDNIRNDAQKHKKNREFQTDMANRLERNTGLNMRQIKNIFLDAGMTFESDDDRGYSLALDFLIDTGVTVPMFYERADSNIIERVYRHGEGALNRLGYNYVMDSVVDELDRVTSNKAIPRKKLEKIGVLATECLHNGRYWGEAVTSEIYDFLNKEADTQELQVGPEFHRHGKVVLLENKPNHNNYFFAEWCENRDIVDNHGDKGVVRNKRWKSSHSSDISSVESTIPDEEVAVLEQLAKLLNEVDEEVDKSKSVDVLTALTTCRDKKSFAEALRRELCLYFNGGEWEIDPSINKSKEIFQEYNQYPKFVDTADLGNLKNEIELAKEKINQPESSKEVLGAVENKIKLRDKIDDYINEIKEHFESKDPDGKTDYRMVLKPYIENIEQVRSIHEEKKQKQANKLINKTKAFAEMCNYFVTSYENTLEVIMKLSSGDTELRPELSNLYESIEEFNKSIEENDSKIYSGVDIEKDIQKIELEDVGIKSVQNRSFNSDEFQTKQAIVLVQDLLSQFLDRHSEMEDIYSGYFDHSNWENKMEGIFDAGDRIPANWTIWYDIRDSSNPKNEDKSDRIKQYIEDQLIDVKNITGDGEFERSDDDEKHIFVNKKENVMKFLNAILSPAAIHEMDVRMAITEEPSGFVKKSKNKIRTTASHSRSNLVGNLSKERNIEKEDYNYITCTDNVVEKLFNDNIIEGMEKFGEPEVVVRDNLRLKDKDIKIDAVCVEF